MFKAAGVEFRIAFGLRLPAVGLARSVSAGVGSLGTLDGHGAGILSGGTLSKNAIRQPNRQA
ncbi:MAG: hypothetical protein ACFB4I_05465 [Cyanophyceae cyanobacterium]